jgi:hypothetical protein
MKVEEDIETACGFALSPIPYRGLTAATKRLQIAN